MAPNIIKKIYNYDTSNHSMIKTTMKLNESDVNNSVVVNNNNSHRFGQQIVWSSVFKLSLLHIIAIYGIYLSIFYAKYQTIIWVYFVATSSAFGILSGAHRLWSHRCYRAHYLLRCLLMILQTCALQNDIYEWSRDHRVHHKFVETDADPHNARRGFFFSHMGWLMVRKHPDVKIKGKTIDMSDLLSDPIVSFQRKYYIHLVLLFWAFIPTVIPIYFWSESILCAFCGNMLRYAISLHHSWLVNSAAHMFGSRPYNPSIEPRENKSVTYLTLGEGYHNYHHTFPYDYSASELGWTHNFNLATAFIDFFALIGLVSDRKVANLNSIYSRKLRANPELKSIAKQQSSSLFDILIGVMVSTWPVWLAFSFRAYYNKHNY